MDWSKCFICLKRKGDLRGTSDGYKQMSQNLLEFRKWGGIEELNFSIIAEGTGTENAPRLITQFTINLVLLLKIQQRTFKETTRRTQGTTEPKY